MTHLDLFSGIGGIALAARWAGFDTRLFCEIDPYCRRVLAKHWPEVPIHGDVRTLDRKALKSHGLSRPTLLTGGFPCQPFSCAGKRRGAADDRHLWPEMFRVIRQCRPAWVVGENVAGFVRLGLDGALADLEGEGYECRAFILPALAVGAMHHRQRCFVVAHAATDRRGFHRLEAADRPETPSGRSAASSESDGNAISYPAGETPLRRDGFSRIPEATEGGGGNFRRRVLRHAEWWEVEPGMGRVADGVPRRVDRLRGLGNAVVPQQIYPILQAIAGGIASAHGGPA